MPSFRITFARLAVLLAVAACAGARIRPPMEFEPLVIEANPGYGLAGKNDEELFAIGSAAFASGDSGRAAEAFARLCDLFPASKHRAAALYDAGLAYERFEAWRLALERFQTLAEGYTGKDADEASFRSAECLYHLGDLDEAHRLLDRLTARTDLETADRIRAVTQRGIVELDAGDTASAEKSLRLAISIFTQAKDRERIDDYYPSQAQFYLGEVFRAHFQAIRLDPSSEDEEKLAKELEEKAEVLLSAQGHYLRAMRMGNAEWAVAAGYRIGELYDQLYQELTEAPLPQGLDEEHARAYREELRKKVHILVTKAIQVYERTLTAAQRAGVNNAFVDETQASLDRMKQILLDAGPEVGPGDAPPLLPDADPDA